MRCMTSYGSCMPQESGFLTPHQAATYLTGKGFEVTPATVQRWCREQKIQRIETPGRHYRIPIEALNALVVTPPAEVAS